MTAATDDLLAAALAALAEDADFMAAVDETEDEEAAA